MDTLLLNRSEVRSLLDVGQLVPHLRRGFIEYSAEQDARALRVRSPLENGNSATVLFPGRASIAPAYTVKVHAKFPGESPAIRGVIALHDSSTGGLLALMDSSHITAVRTGLVGAMAADELANPGAGRVAVVGTGVQGRQMLEALASMRPLQRARAYDLDSETAVRFSRETSKRLAIPVEPVASLEAALGDADIVLVATWSREPLILPGMLARGAHVSTLGADEPGKAEIAGEVIAASRFVCDDRELAVEMGALCGVGLGPEAISAELGEVFAGIREGRVSPDEITLFAGVGLAFQDAAAAWLVFEAGRVRRVGRGLDFLA